MLMQTSRGRPTCAHVVVLGNEKGGAGKSTIAMHVAVALLNLGQRVATIDLDLRQKTLTHYIENRRGWAKQSGSRLTVPSHYCVARGTTQNLEDNETIEFGGFVDALYQDALNRSADAAGRASFLAALANGTSRQSVADILFHSDEYRQDLIQSFYQRFLHRPADSAGLAAWVASLRAGTHDEAAIAQIVGSPEYFSRL